MKILSAMILMMMLVWGSDSENNLLFPIGSKVAIFGLGGPTGHQWDGKYGFVLNGLMEEEFGRYEIQIDNENDIIFIYPENMILLKQEEPYECGICSQELNVPHVKRVCEDCNGELCPECYKTVFQDQKHNCPFCRYFPRASQVKINRSKCTRLDDGEILPGELFGFVNGYEQVTKTYIVTATVAENLNFDFTGTEYTLTIKDDKPTSKWRCSGEDLSNLTPELLPIVYTIYINNNRAFITILSQHHFYVDLSMLDYKYLRTFGDEFIMTWITVISQKYTSRNPSSVNFEFMMTDPQMIMRLTVLT
jgi:hypothetical protein